MTLVKATEADFDKIYTEMQKSFIPEEIRDRDEALATLFEEDYSIYKLIEGDVWVGFITLWKLSEYTFIEHFVVFSEFRSRGYGALCLEEIKAKAPRLVLEAEPPTDVIKCRRIEFYKRCEFYVNDYPYMQPSYKKHGTGVELVLMSYPMPLRDCEAIKDELYRKVYKKGASS